MMYVSAETPEQAALLEKCEQQLLALILPNRPVGDGQVAAFSRAVYAQYEHEERQMAVPEGITSFRMGSFSATLDGASRPACAEARAILLNAGLLYRGAKC